MQIPPTSHVNQAVTAIDLNSSNFSSGGSGGVWTAYHAVINRVSGSVTRRFALANSSTDKIYDETADRAVTLSTTNVYNGVRFRVIRTANATGAFNLNVGTGPLKAMGTAGSFCDVEYNGSAWILTAYGTKHLDGLRLREGAGIGSIGCMKTLINIGCGPSPDASGPSWRNYDASPTLRFERIPIIGRLYTKNATRFPEIAMYGDITKGPLCEENAADAVFASHVLEHMPYSTMTSALENIYVMLKPGGVFRLIVPDLRSRAKKYLECQTPEAAHEFMRRAHLGVEDAHSIKSRLFTLFGHSHHLWMYDERSMRAELAARGFTDIRACRYGDSEIPEFAEVEEEGRFTGGTADGREVALECRKPI